MLQEREHILEICRQMNKGIYFNINQYIRTTLHKTMTYSMLICFIYLLYYLPGREKKPTFFLALLQ